MTKPDEIKDNELSREEIVLSTFYKKKSWVHYINIRKALIPDKEKRKEIRKEVTKDQRKVDARKYVKTIFEKFGYIEYEPELQRTLNRLCKKGVLFKKGSGVQAQYKVNEDFGFLIIKNEHENIIKRCPPTEMRIWSDFITSYGFTLQEYEGYDDIMKKYNSIKNDLESLIKRTSELWFEMVQKDIESMGLIKSVEKPKILITMDVPISEGQFKNLKNFLVSKSKVSSSQGKR